MGDNSKPTSKPLRVQGQANAPKMVTPQQPQLLLMAGQVAQTAMAAAKPVVDHVVSAAQVTVGHPKPIIKKPHWWAWVVLVGLVLLAALLGYFVFGRLLHKTQTQTANDNVTPFLRTFDVVQRSSTIPSGTLTLSNGQLVPKIADPASYYSSYSLELSKADASGQISESVVLGSFAYGDKGQLLDLSGNPQTGFSISDTTAYNQARILVNTQSAGSVQPVFLRGPVPKTGQSVDMTFPLNFKSSLGRAVASYSADLKKYSVGTELSGLPDVSAQGWKYNVWLATLDGPYVKGVKNLGSFSAGSDGAASHGFSSADTLATYNTLVVTLEPADSGDQKIGPIRILSANIDLK